MAGHPSRFSAEDVDGQWHGLTLLALYFLIGEQRFKKTSMDRSKGRAIPTERLWTYVRDDRPAGNSAAPAVWFAYSPDREGERAEQHLRQFRGTCRPMPTQASISSMPIPASSKPGAGRMFGRQSRSHCWTFCDSGWKQPYRNSRASRIRRRRFAPRTRVGTR